MMANRVTQPQGHGHSPTRAMASPSSNRHMKDNFTPPVSPPGVWGKDEVVAPNVEASFETFAHHLLHDEEYPTSPNMSPRARTSRTHHLKDNFQPHLPESQNARRPEEESSEEENSTSLEFPKHPTTPRSVTEKLTHEVSMGNSNGSLNAHNKEGHRNSKTRSPTKREHTAAMEGSTGSISYDGSSSFILTPNGTRRRHIKDSFIPVMPPELDTSEEENLDMEAILWKSVGALDTVAVVDNKQDTADNRRSSF